MMRRVKVMVLALLAIVLATACNGQSSKVQQLVNRLDETASAVGNTDSLLVGACVAHFQDVGLAQGLFHVGDDAHGRGAVGADVGR